MVDYRRFLAKEASMVLPYFGGGTVDAPDRRLRVAEPFEPIGWYRFTVKGRVATKTDAAERPDLSALPVVRGHFVDGRLVHAGAVAELLQLLPSDEPAALALIRARRWPSGELLFDELEFETEVEGQVREALASDVGLSTVKAVPSTLRAAYAYSVAAKVSRRLQIAASAAELKPHIPSIAEAGVVAAEAALAALHAEREQARTEMAELERRRQAQLAAQEMKEARDGRMQRAQVLRVNDPAAFRRQVTEAATDALAAAGAALETSRMLANHQIEVVFRYMGERFISVADAATLRVIDSGICLGHPPRDGLVTLDSLPSVIREAIDTGRLVILRHP